MSRMRSGVILLLLAVPFALYGAWQVQSVAGTNLGPAEPPSEKGLPGKDQLAAARARAERWAGDVRRAAAVALQYRAPTAEDAIEDPAAKSVAAAAAARAADLTDLEKFLAGGTDAVFAGAVRARYRDWQESKKRLTRAEQAVNAWLSNPLPSAVDGAAAAATAVKGFEDLVTEYRGASEFADLGKADVWRVEARLKVVQALDAEARAPFAEAMKLPLPFKKGDPAVARAVGAPAAIREQVRLLRDDLGRAEDARREVPPRLAKAAAEALARDAEWAAKAELLGLFADPELFTDAEKAREWVPKVQTQFNKAQSERDEIKRKVRQFCDAYVPRAVRLDGEVLIFKAGAEVKREARAAVTVVYDSDAKDQKLTDSADGDRLNEFNYLKLFRNPDEVRWENGSRFGSVKSTEIRPTDASVVARDYAAARKAVTTWSTDTVNRLKTACEGEDGALQQKRRDLADALLGGEPGGDKKPAPKVWTRLSALAAAMEKHKGLFEGP